MSTLGGVRGGDREESPYSIARALIFAALYFRYASAAHFGGRPTLFCMLSRCKTRAPVPPGIRRAASKMVNVRGVATYVYKSLNLNILAAVSIELGCTICLMVHRSNAAHVSYLPIQLS
jgi:hypothetical protein